MKAAAFSYARQTSVVNALHLFVAHRDRAKVPRVVEPDAGDQFAFGPTRTDCRYRRTNRAAKNSVGGSLAHADPASELPACMVALNEA
jgi:carbon-monoxide dehydrogenase medium subunit